MQTQTTAIELRQNQIVYSTVNGSGFLSLDSIGIQASGRKLTQQLEPNMVMQPILDDDRCQ